MSEQPKTTFEEMESLTTGQLTSLRDANRRELNTAKQSRYNLMAEIMFLQREIEKEKDK